MLKSLYRFLSPRFQTLFSEYKVDMKPRYGHGLPPHQQLYDIINSQRQTYEELLNSFRGYGEQLQTIKTSDQEKDGNQPAWNNGFLPGLDIVSLYSLIALKKPAHYVEVGSGNSTKVAHKAKSDHSLSVQITSIDPHPRAEIDHLADRVIRQPFEETDYAAVLNLGENDILFIDNSHRVLPNSDATVFFLEILPRLKKGVIVHIHDIYLPYDYPQFMCDRFYSEQYALAAFLLANPDKYRTLMPCYFVSEDKELSERIAPVFEHPSLKEVERHGGSYWLQIQ